ncbi:MAG: hypothetical protein V2I67_16865 [Thermoanaerobaculales bacterium]|nr:hypothetical protein [Thermoanaerobaculales bacterium]
MTLIYIFIFGSVLVFGITAVAGFVWAIRTGQMRNFSAGATSIFDDEEPVGLMTDAFPDAGSAAGPNPQQEGRDSGQ